MPLLQRPSMGPLILIFNKEKIMKTPPIVIGFLSLSVLSACSSQPTAKPTYLTAPPVNINNAALMTPITYVKPLPPLTPLSITKVTPKTTLSPIIKKTASVGKPISVLRVWPQERYIDAISRWLNNEGFANIAWELPPNVMERLNQKPTKKINFYSNYRKAIPALANQLDQKMHLHLRHTPQKIAAIVPWEGDTTLTMVKGDSLATALASLTKTYQWQWIAQDQQGYSYRSRNNYPFPAPYPIATPKGDIGMALSHVLAPFPVTAHLLDSTRTVFIMDEK